MVVKMLCAMVLNFEKQRLDIKPDVNGRCCKYELLKCPACIKTLETRIVQMVVL